MLSYFFEIRNTMHLKFIHSNKIKSLEMTTTDAEPISTIIAKKEFLSKRYQTVDNGILNRLWRLYLHVVVSP